MVHQQSMPTNPLEGLNPKVEALLSGQNTQQQSHSQVTQVEVVEHIIPRISDGRLAINVCHGSGYGVTADPQRSLLKFLVEGLDGSENELDPETPMWFEGNNVGRTEEEPLLSRVLWM
jgi:hypothetical protein